MRGGDVYLSKREQQIMEIVYAHGQVTTLDAMRLLPGSPANSTVRTHLRILEEKGHLRHEERDGKFIYKPVRPRGSAARSALAKVVQTFYRGSVGSVLVALLSDASTKLSDDEIARLQALIDEAREGGR
jgi:predicted transcriptional regulator